MDEGFSGNFTHGTLWSAFLTEYKVMSGINLSAVGYAQIVVCCHLSVAQLTPCYGLSSAASRYFFF